MPDQVTVDDIVPLIAALTPVERARLLRLIAEPKRHREPSKDASLYGAMPPTGAEFSVDEEQLAWESEDWESLA